MNLTIQYFDYPPVGMPRGYYITDPDAEYIEAGPFPTLKAAEVAFEELTEPEPDGDDYADRAEWKARL